MVLLKFWMHISEKAQRERFEARRGDPLKSWKLTDEDWRNIARRADYEKAVADMLKRTDHEQAPWRVVAAESKPYARVVVVEAVIEALEQGLREAGQEPIELEAML
jgi:polyphosphate kinase 2 (PPK2 family)